MNRACGHSADKGAQVQSASLRKIKDTLQSQPQSSSTAQLSSLCQGFLNLSVFICKMDLIKPTLDSYLKI